MCVCVCVCVRALFCSCEVSRTEACEFGWVWSSLKRKMSEKCQGVSVNTCKLSLSRIRLAETPTCSP